MPFQLPDVSKTLEQLDGQVWGEPEWQSHLVLECHRLRRVPLGEFTPADLRILIGQSMDLEFLVPLAFQALAHDPLLDAEYYAGDLLSALLRSDTAFWTVHPDLRAELASIAEEGKLRFEALDECDRELSASAFYDDLSHFQRSA
ncbi:MAG: contact-dependent growth inhibition system immunity protein [Chthoniobacter sp.]|nr:contact-dependent growth inhibition system immunity protein [Chthoniobacter sp.]